MRKIMTLLQYVLFGVFIAFSAQSQDMSPKRLAVLPFNVIGVDSVSGRTAGSILRMELGKTGKFELIPEKSVSAVLDESPCEDPACALKIGARLNAEQVLYGNLSALGEKVIVQYVLTDVAFQKAVIQDRLTSVTLEDLDMVMKRVAMSIARGAPGEETAEVGAILESETRTPRRRRGSSVRTYSIGYIFPSSGYQSLDREIALDYCKGIELDHYTYGMQFSIRKGFAVNLYGARFLSKKDFSPFVGGGFGFHWFTDDQGDGVELILKTGIQLIRTYNFILVTNLDFITAFNEDNNTGFVFTIGASI